MAQFATIFVVFYIVSQLVCGISANVVFCYFGNWARYRSGSARFLLTDLSKSSNLCTHWLYAFIGLVENGTIVSLNSYIDYDLDYLNQFNYLKSTCNIKTLLSIGGWNQGSTQYSTVVGNPTLRTAFVQSALNWTLTYGFDGLDIDWEYPAQRGGIKEDKENYPLLLAELRSAFDKQGLILTAAVEASTKIDISYNVRQLSKYLDYINIMTYDLRSVYAGYTAHHTGLYASKLDTTEAQLIANVNASIHLWLERGANASKIVLGITSTSKSFTLQNAYDPSLGAKTSGPGKAGVYTHQNGTLAYYEICHFVKSDNWTVVWDNTQKVPHAYSGDQWVGYDNPESIAAKVNYSVSYNLAGIMLWAIDLDDFGGICGDSYPILNAVKSAYAAFGISNSNKCNLTDV